MSASVTETTVEAAALAWLEAIGWRITHGLDIAPEQPLAALRDALLPKLIRGEIRVKDAEQFLKERGL